MEVGEQAAVAVEAAWPMAEADGAPQHHRLQRPLGLSGERPGHEPGPAKGQLGRLDADQAHLGDTVDGALQPYRVAVHHIADNGAPAVLQPHGGEGRRARQKGGQEKCGEGVAAVVHGRPSITERRARMQNGAR